MKSKSAVIFVLALVAIGISYLAWSEHLQLEDLKAASFSADERAELQKRIWDAQKKIQDLQGQLAGPPTARKAVAGAPSDAGQDRVGGGGLTSNILSRMNDPEAQKILADQAKAQIERRYADLFAKLKLSPEKQAEFENLLVERQMAAMDVLSTANDQGVSDPQDFQKLLQSAQSDIDSQIKATLGDAAYGQYQDDQQSQAVHNVVNQLQTNLSHSEAPLTADQSTQMEKLIAQTSPTKASLGGTGPLSSSASGLITDAAISQAQGFLSPTQVQALQGLQQQQQAQLRLRQIILQNQAGGAPAAPATTGP